MIRFLVGLMVQTGLLMLAACGTMAPPPAVDSLDLPEFYNCEKSLHHPELGEFSIRKGLTLEGRPYKPFNEASYFTARWRTFSLRKWTLNAGRSYHDLTISWHGEDAATMSTEVTGHLTFLWQHPQPKKYWIQLSRKSARQPEPFVNLGYRTPSLEYHPPQFAYADGHKGDDAFFFRVSDLLAFAGSDKALIATVYDENGQATQSMDLNMQELRDGVAQMRNLLVELESETSNFTHTCQRVRDEMVVVTGAAPVVD